MADPDEKPRKRGGISPELESIFNSALSNKLAEAQASARTMPSRPSMAAATPDVSDPMFNNKVDRIDRESLSRQQVRANTYQPGAMADAIAGDTPGSIDQLLATPENTDQSVLDPALAANVTPEAISATNNRSNPRSALGAIANPAITGLAKTKYVPSELTAPSDDERFLIQNPPLNSLKNQMDRQTFLISKYPTLALGLAQGKYSEKEVRNATNFAVAFESAAFLGSPSLTPEQRRAYMSYMSPMQQLLVLDIGRAIENEMAQQAQDGTLPRSEEEKAADIQAAADSTYEQFTVDSPELAGLTSPGRYLASSISERVARQQIIGEEDTGNAVKTGWNSLWNWTGGWVLDAYNDLINTNQTLFRAAAIGFDKLGGGQYSLVWGTNLGFADGETTWDQVWEMAQPGAMDPTIVNQVREQYGSRKTELAIRILNAMDEQDPDVLPQIVLELTPLANNGDTEANELLQWLGDISYANSERRLEATSILDELQFARTGNTGNVFYASAFGVPAPEDRLEAGRSDLYKTIATGGSVYGQMLDPLWFAGPIRTGMMASRYGIWKMMASEGLERSDEFSRMFAQPTVNRAFTQLGSNLKAIDEAGDLGKAGQLRKSVEAQWKRYFAPEAIDEMRSYMRSLPEGGDVTPYSTRAFQDFFEANENLVHIITGQSARRTRQVVVPHMTAATVMVKKYGLAVRGLTYQSGQGAQYIDDVVGPGWTKTMPPEAADTLAKALEDANTFDEVTQVLSDFRWTVDGQMERSFLGTVVAKPGFFDEARYGFRTKGGLLSRRGFERARKPFQRFPMDDSPLLTANGSQARRVGDLLEHAGIPRYFARAVEEIWADPRTTQAQRESLGPGLEKLAMRSLGVDQFDKGYQQFYSRVSGATRGDIYSPLTSNMTEVAPQIRQQTRTEINEAIAGERASRFAELGRDSFEVGDEVWVWQSRVNGGTWVSGPVTQVRRNGNIVVKGLGEKPQKAANAIPKTGNVAPFEVPASRSGDELARILDGAAEEHTQRSISAEQRSVSNTTERGRDAATARLAAHKSRAATVRLRRVLGDTYGRAFTRSARRRRDIVLADGSTVTPVAIYRPSRQASEIMDEAGMPLTEFVEISDAQKFNELISTVKAQHKYGAAVTAYDPSEYEGMRLFITPEGDAGFALKGDDIVSVFKAEKSENKRFALSAMILAISQGGRRADAFETVLPELYARVGMRPVARLAWNDEFAPEGWDFATFGKYNGGRPDVSFFVYDPAYTSRFAFGEGIQATSYEHALIIQDAALRSLSGAEGVSLAREWAAPMIDANYRKIVSDRLRQARSDAQLQSASEYAPGVHGAVVMPDATDHIWFPNLAAMDRYTRKASVFTALLGNNPFMGGLTDAWVLGTLAGPRFQVRSGIEDAGMYALTGGELGAVTTGRAMSQAALKGTMRTKNVHRNSVLKSGQTAKTVVDGNGKIVDFVSKEADRPQKLGLVATGWRSLINGMTGKGFTAASKRRAGLNDMTYDSALDTLNQVLVTQATPNELRLAHEAALSGDRQVLASLIGSLYVRQRLAGHPLFSWVAKLGGKDTARLSEAEQDVVRYLYEGVYFGDLLRGNDEAAELGSHLFDNAPIAAPHEIELGVVKFNKDKGQWERIVRQNDEYVSVPMTGDENQLRSWWNSLAKAMPVADGPKGYAALVRLRAYVQAIQTGDVQTVERLIGEVADVIEQASASAKWNYMERMRIANMTGSHGLAKATLENLRALLTTRNGDLNWTLYGKLKRTVTDPVTGKERTEWGMRYVDPDTDKIVYTINITDLRQLTAKDMPAQIVINRGQEVALGVEQTWSQMMWGGMGRSLARITRSPIFMGQYVKSRQALAPLQKRRFQRLIDEGFDQQQAHDLSAEWAVQAATERAYETTMAYVDNPAIRSNLAWNVRNVARFYRALEDFGRRMVRTARNEPSFYAKLAATWRVIDSGGWFWEDEYGQSYFIWPGTHAMFESLNWFMNNVVDRGALYTPALPMAYSSDVTNLTPSADPNAIFPTFSGLYASIAVLPIIRAFPSLFNVDIEKEVFGEYSQGTSIWMAAVPPNVMRAIALLPTFGDTSGVATQNRLDQDPGASPLSGTYISAAMSAIQAAAAAGWWNENEKMTPQMRADLNRRIDRVAQWTVGLKFVLSPIVPAAMSIAQLDSSEVARSLGYDDLRSEFIALLKQADNMDEAMVAWMRMYPDGKSPFAATIGRSGSDPNKGYWAPFNEVANFAEENQSILDKNPRGLSYFQPADGRTTLRAFEILKVNDLAPRGSALTLLNKVLTAQSDAILEQNQKLYLMEKFAGRANATVWSETRNRLINGAEGSPAWPNIGSNTVTVPNDSYKPLRGTKEYEAMPVALMRQAGEDLRDAGRLDQRGEAIMDLIAKNEFLYDQIYPHSKLDKDAAGYREYARDQWYEQIYSAVTQFPDDNVMMSALREMTLHIGFQWPTELEVANG